jgi:hypothetical protein
LKKFLSGPLRPLQLHGHQVVGIRALRLNGVALPPGEISSELEGGQIRENVMVEVPAQAGRIVTTDIEGISDLVTGAAFPLYTGDGSYHFLSDSWITGHFFVSPF